MTRRLLIGLAWMLLLPVLVAFLVFAAVMALVCEGSAELLWWVDWPAVRRGLRRWAHVAWAGWSS